MDTDESLMEALSPFFSPDMPADGKAKALEYYKEIRFKPVEELAVLLAIQHKITENAIRMVEASERRQIVSGITKTVYGPNGKNCG